MSERRRWLGAAPKPDWHGLGTPCAVVDRARLERNCRWARERAEALGVRLRPHIKTHKCVEIGLVQHGGRPGPVTVSTLAEARGFLAAGFDDLIWAVPPPLSRLAEALALTAGAARCDLLADHPATVGHLREAARAAARTVGVFVKLDCGAGRAGVPVAEAAAAARLVAAAPELELRGLLTHAGQAYGCRSRDEARRVAGTERDQLLAAAAELAAAGLPVAERSLGSTPTFAAVDGLAGITEVRPGNYAYFDAFQAALGSCALDQVAFTVLAEVIGSYPARSELLLNAGALALSKDPGPTHLDPGCGFGVVLDLGGCPLAGARLVSLTQEHGVVRCADPTLIEQHPIGSRLRIVPNHSCLAAACFDRVHVLADGEVVDCWPTLRGW